MTISELSFTMTLYAFFFFIAMVNFKYIKNVITQYGKHISMTCLASVLIEKQKKMYTVFLSYFFHISFTE